MAVQQSYLKARRRLISRMDLHLESRDGLLLASRDLDARPDPSNRSSGSGDRRNRSWRNRSVPIVLTMLIVECCTAGGDAELNQSARPLVPKWCTTRTIWVCTP
jgi:hypothetical protein